MNYYVIGDEDTVLGFNYVGIPGRVVESAAEATEVFDQACADPGIGIVIVNESVARSIRERINEVRFRAVQPVVVEIPGPGGPDPDRSSLMKLIQEAVGIKL